ncbi:P52 family lipoprotein [Borreliella americana]|uniref:P52 family lipoprotein n=1 Tax=Borreliella americana TaxID=478807 RepID=UPI001E36C7A4|nr:P52 family lipoprotein [Borreliella americana]
MYNKLCSDSLVRNRTLCFSDLKLSWFEHCILNDMKMVMEEFNNSTCFPLENYDEKDFDEFFLKLGSKRSKELINLFRKIKNRISEKSFEIEVFILYLCIDDPCTTDIFYIDEGDNLLFDEDDNSFDGNDNSFDGNDNSFDENKSVWCGAIITFINWIIALIKGRHNFFDEGHICSDKKKHNSLSNRFVSSIDQRFKKMKKSLESRLELEMQREKIELELEKKLKEQGYKKLEEIFFNKFFK